jgi:hypothetical protein
MLRFLLEWQRPEKWGKHPKIDVPQKGGVLVCKIADNSDPLRGIFASKSDLSFPRIISARSDDAIRIRSVW